MRTHFRYSLFIPFLATASVLVCLVGPIFAQETRPPTPNTSKDQKAAVTSYDLEIRDGILIWNGAKRNDHASGIPASLQNVVDLLRDLHPDANFVVSPDVRDTLVADLKMRTSSVEEKLEAIRIASGSVFLSRNAHLTPIDPTTGLPATPGGKPTPPLYVLEGLPVTAKPGLQVEAFNIGAYLNSFPTLSGKGTEEDIAKRMDQIERMALETVKQYEAMNIAKGKSIGAAPSIRFHAGANLVIIIGEPETVAVAAKVIGALPGAQRSAASEAPAYDPSQKMDEVIRKLQRDGALPAPRR